MNIADGIRRIGFRRWYERQLIESHVYLVTGFLSMIAVVACVEALGSRASGWTRVIIIALIAAGIALCAWSVGRYKTVMERAEHAAMQSVCSACKAYGGLEVLQSGSAPVDDGSEPWLKVRCRKCGHQWTMD